MVVFNFTPQQTSLREQSSQVVLPLAELYSSPYHFWHSQDTPRDVTYALATQFRFEVGILQGTEDPAAIVCAVVQTESPVFNQLPAGSTQHTPLIFST